MYEQISKDTLKELFKIWKAKNIEDLDIKTSNVSMVSFKFFSLSIEFNSLLSFLSI